MKKYILLCITIMLFVAARVGAQDSYSDRVKKYIDQYHQLALAEQRTSGIPACITLGQGILETEAGASELMTEANNHFGIKCSNNWDGPTFTHTDDAPDECFKKYSCAAESYHDHSMHLKRNQRYAPLFKISTTDYAAWAVCLKKCGYATNPQYAQRLIKIIEDFELQKYTYSALDSTTPIYELTTTDKPMEDTALIIRENKSMAMQETVKDTAKMPALDSMQDLAMNDSSFEDSSKIVKVNGMKAFYAHKGEMLLGYAVKYNVRYPRLLEMNDLKDGPLPYDMYLYLEKKMTTGTHAAHEVMSGENMLLISQSEGIQLKKLISLNLLYPNEEPVVGSVLQLQKQATKRPEAMTAAVTAHKENAILAADNTEVAPAGDYIAINKPSAVVADVSAPAAVVAETTETDVIPVAPPVKRSVAVPVHKVTKSAKVTKKGTAGDEDLAGLKADLDKVVYADDSKLTAGKTKTVSPAKKGIVAESAKPNVAATGGSKYYTIKKGETAYSIAKRNNITVAQLYEMNDIDATGIKVGKTIQVK